MTNLVCSLALWALVQTTCAEYDLPPEPVYALILAESGGDPNAVGDDGAALGLAQFHEATFLWMAEMYGTVYTWPDDAYNPESAVRLLCMALDDGRAAHWRGWKKIPHELVPPQDDKIWWLATEEQLEMLGVPSEDGGHVSEQLYVWGNNE